jgi:hypothetical protein
VAKTSVEVIVEVTFVDKAGVNAAKLAPELKS